jgi:hypothetical protein
MLLLPDFNDELVNIWTEFAFDDAICFALFIKTFDTDLDLDELVTIWDEF